MRSPPDRRGNATNTSQHGALYSHTTLAQEILQALRNVLREAQVRGIELSASFLHFDRRQQGLVGVDDLMAALVELHILAPANVWSEHDVEECVEEISAYRSRSYFSREDFCVYFSKPPKQHPTNDENLYHTERTPKTSKLKKQAASTWPLTDDGHERMRVGFSLSNNDTSDDTVDNTAATVATKKKKATHKRPLGSLLPNWAHARSKRALKELEELTKKRPRGLHLQSRPQSGEGTATSVGVPGGVPPLNLIPESSSDHEVGSTRRDNNDQQSEMDSARSEVSSVDKESEDGDANSSEIVHFPVDPKWKLFDLDHDTTLSYVFLTHDLVASSSPRRLPKTPGGASQEDIDAAHGLTTPFRFTVFLDVFQRIETIQTFFEPLLTRFPRGKILVCGFPTKMRRTTLLNDEFLAAAYAKLLLYLMETSREWLIQPKTGIAAMPQYVVAFGSGAQVALQLLTTEIPLHATATAPRLALFAQAQRGLVIINGVVSASSDSSIRIAWNSWRRLLTANDNSVEWHEALLRSLFSEYYLTQVAHSRQQAMETFFHSRKSFLQGSGLELLRALVRGVVKNNGSGVTAIANLVEFSTAPFGVVAVHSTSDELSPPAQMELLGKAFPSRAESLSDCLALDARDPSLYVAWLKSGHEVIQERATFLHELLRQLVLAPVAIPPRVHSDDNGGATTTTAATDAALSPKHTKDEELPLSVSPQPATPATDATTPRGNRPPIAAEPSASEISIRVRQLMAEKGFKWIQQELYDREIEGSGPTQAVLEKYEHVLLSEAQKEREKQLQMCEKQLKHDAFEAEKRAKQADELERILREQEIDNKMKQKEYESRKLFFEQMEKQKERHSKWLFDQQQMELEDVLSMKFNDLFRLDEEIRDRNLQMGKKVASLERERQEKEREKFQVELQQQRLESQHKKRDELHQFQAQFEQNALVCSAVEAYQLDLRAEYDQFLAIVEGTNVLSHDLARFYELKTLQMDENVSKRLQFDAQGNEIAAKELVLRNLERVLQKAKTTGMVAKAGLGTVRVVPISPAEIQAIVQECDVKKDQLASLLHDHNLLSQQMAWQDTMLQRLSVLTKRNENFQKESLVKLDECCDKGNEMVLCVREEMENLMEKRAKNDKLLQKIQIRLQLVQDEEAKALACGTQYFDTRLRVEGATQRVLKSVLLKELALEKEELTKRLVAGAKEEGQFRTTLAQLTEKRDEYASVTFRVEQAKMRLAAVVPPKNPAARGDQRRASSGADTKEDTATSDSEDGSLADRVRRKLHADRTLEEKKWVAMDFTLNFAYYYKHIDAAQVEIIQKHPDYQQTVVSAKSTAKPLTKQQLERLLTLPARNCLALAFLKSQDELEAFTLLRKYTFGDGEQFFVQVDREFVLPGTQTPRACVVETLEQVVAAIDKVESPLLRGQSVLLLEKTSAPEPLVLFSASQQQIPPHKTVTHAFQLPSYSRTSGSFGGVISLTVSIVLQGHFKSTGYQNGRLAAMLYVIPSQRATAPIAIGKCVTSTGDIALCTPHSLGKLVLRHDPTAKPVSPDATYQVVLGAPVLTTYSIEISAKTARFASDVLRYKRTDALRKQELLPSKKDEIVNVFTTIQLSERKKRLAKKMANDAKEIGRQAELEILRESTKLEKDNATPTLPQEERRALHGKIQAAESKFTYQCFLFAQREEEVRDIETALKELTTIHANLLDQVDKMEHELVEYRSFLPSLAAVLVESNDAGDRDAAGARLAKELHVEYENRFGKRSGKVFWAELSAMKAALPSMMTPAEKVRRKYKKGVEVLDKKEREWILLDRIQYPRKYEWENRLVAASGGGTGPGGAMLRLHGTHPRLTKDEEQLAVLSQMEVDRIMKAPWNLLARKEIQVRKIVTKFRDDTVNSHSSTSSSTSRPTTMTTVMMLRGLKASELTRDEREWKLYDQLVNPVYYPATLQHLASELAATGSATALPPIPAVPAHITREDLIEALNTPEEELFKLPSELLHGRNLLLKYDPQLSVNLMEAARMEHAQQTHQLVVEKVEMDVDARCRNVYKELQRAIANTRNEFMDSSTLHTTLQRFPTKVLRLELEKELDKLLMAQIGEKEQFEWEQLLKKKENIKPGGARGKKLTTGHSGQGGEDEDAISDSDSDEEAVIAREQRDQKKKQTTQSGRDKVRGKALTTKTLQKQRREIKDALQPRNLEQQRLLVQEQTLGVGGCMACRTNPCVWKPYLEESFGSIQARIEVLQEELERVKRAPELVVSSKVCLAAIKSGNRAITMRKSDLFDELTLELKTWDQNLKLREVDKEFHDTFTSKNAFFETQALHGFRQIQQKEKVQRALGREHSMLVANLTASEVVEDLLESLLEGWVFGERESERQALGFVPSLKRDAPLSLHDLRRLEQEKRISNAKNELVEDENVQGMPLEKWKPIQVAAFEINEQNKAVKKGSALDKQLNETENALKFGIFCMTLMYFRGLSLLKKQKTVWSTSALSKNNSGKPLGISKERQKMDFQARNVVLRTKKHDLYDQKARIGNARKQKMDEQRTAAYRKRMILETQKAKREAKAAIHVQRVFRGFMGRRAGRKWMIRRREIDAQRALGQAAAIMLQRAYRGRLGRIKAEERRIELAEFISQIRAEEAIDEEEEYWKKHRVERVARQVAAFVKKQA